MSYRLLKMKRKCQTSPASRFCTIYRNSWLMQDKYKKLSIYPKWRAGRNDSGRTVFWTRGKLLHKQKKITINYSLRYKKIGFIAAFHFIPFKNKLSPLIFFSNGTVSYLLATQRQKIFSFFCPTMRKKFKKRFKLRTSYLLLAQIKKLSFVSFLELFPGSGVKYCRSAGTSARIMKFDKSVHTALLKLPSGVRKLFSTYSYALRGKLNFTSHKYSINNKAGYWRSFGKKPIVRGVAMNPVDHPHGGRTKSIKYPRTPWGKTTKFK